MQPGLRRGLRGDRLCPNASQEDQMLDQRKFYIDGAWVDPVQARDLDVIDSAYLVRV